MKQQTESNIVKRLLEWMQEKHLPDNEKGLRAAGEMLGIPYAALAGIRTYKAEPTFECLKRMAEAFECGILELTRGKKGAKK